MDAETVAILLYEVENRLEIIDLKELPNHNSAMESAKLSADFAVITLRRLVNLDA